MTDPQLDSMRYSVELLNKVQLRARATAPTGMRIGAKIGVQAANLNRVYSSFNSRLNGQSAEHKRSVSNGKSG
jgi:hypothetical protein